MEPLRLDKNNDLLHQPPKTIEEKLEEAEKSYKEGKNYPEEEVWTMFRKEYGYKL